jgi:hypothetical protein
VRPEEEEHLELQCRASEGRDALGVRIEVLAIFLVRDFLNLFLPERNSPRTNPRLSRF